MVYCFELIRIAELHQRKGDRRVSWTDSIVGITSIPEWVPVRVDIGD